MHPKDKRILVTGADGFIGSHLTELLVREGARVTALAQYNSFNHWGWLEDIPCRKDVEVVTGDIRDPHFCTMLVKDQDAVLHLAALIPIPYSYRAPDSYVDTNVKGTLNLCQAALAGGVEKFLHTSTSEVYGTAQYVPIDEKHPLSAQSPYSATKIAADAIVTSFHHSFQLPATIVRPFNSYGPRQSARAVIPTIIAQIASGSTEIHLGNTTTTRDFTFVQDTSRGFLAVLGLETNAGEVFHVGSNTEVSVGELFALIADLMNSDARIVEDLQRVRPAASEVLRLRCDDTKLKNATGFVPCVALKEGLARTIAWFSEPGRLGRYKPDIYNV
jgi:NAD dependent epimerase/dehydratase